MSKMLLGSVPGATPKLTNRVKSFQVVGISPLLAMLRDQCLLVLREPHVVLGDEPRLVTCKVSTLFALILLRSQVYELLFITSYFNALVISFVKE